MKESQLEYVLTHAYRDQMIDYLNQNPDEFEEAIELAVSDKQPYSWRAAWILNNLIEGNEARFQPLVPKILEALPERKDNQQRDLIRLLLHLELDDDQEGWLFDHCISLWEKIGKKPAVRYAAFRYIARVADKYPEVKSEIKFLVGPQYTDGLSPGLARSITKMITRFKL